MLVVVFVALMFILSATKLDYEIEMPGQFILSGAIFVLGLLVIAVGGYSFKKVNTTIDPMTPEQSTQLVTTGIYSYSRNPMYVGFLAWLIAAVIFFGNIVNLLLLPFYILLVNRIYIIPEETALEKLFMKEYSEYSKNVRRWL